MTTAPRRGKPKIMAPKKHGPEFSVDKTWTELKKNIREIQIQNASNLSFEENHRFAYNMVLNKQGETLYKGVKDLVVENLDSMAKERIEPVFPSGTTDATVLSDEDSRLLRKVKDVWEEHTNNMIRLGQILKYMDRVYTKTANVPQTQELGLELFLKQIMKTPIKDHIVRSVLNQIRHERDGCPIGRSTVKGCVDVFISLHIDHSTTIYKRDLEPAILKESEEFYLNEGVRLLAECDAPTFLSSVESRFKDEDSRVHHYLSSQTSGPLLAILDATLLVPHLLKVIEKPSGLDFMIDSNKFDDLTRLMDLCVKVPSGLQILRSAIKESIVRRGKAINDASRSDDSTNAGGEKPVEEDGSAKKDKGKTKTRAAPAGIQPALTWVFGVLTLKDKFDELWRKSFKSNREVESSMIGAFQSFMNMNNKASEFLSFFIDDHLKKGLKGKTDDEVEVVLEKTITVFRFIAEKDIFERYYKRHLSKRLLNGRSVSDDAERGMLAKLKTECGFQFTQKMEGMFIDMRVSADTSRDYANHISQSKTPELDLSVIIMTSGAWPVPQTPPVCIIPPRLGSVCESFQRFYLSRHNGRRLTWQPHLGSADVNIRFNARTHEVNVSTFALVILLLFEDVEDDHLSYNHIREATNIEEGELKRHLQSLACTKFKILRKHPQSREIDDADSFTFNQDFTYPGKKFKIATVLSKLENNDERRDTMERIEEERKVIMEACIVRVMKSRKNMSHNDLVHEVSSQLASKFQPEPSGIKRCIERLIDQEYLSRGDDRKSYGYIVSLFYWSGVQVQ
ncbi:Cullin [Crepidotus variabilis]|uniref:Cullin n=1 Tax=Crepidotus variabilis TaxID=179855 RepID=A0A9P6JU90_9AGAR|nr:Cullin [Crepidotus variabilis]